MKLTRRELFTGIAVVPLAVTTVNSQPKQLLPPTVGTPWTKPYQEFTGRICYRDNWDLP